MKHLLALACIAILASGCTPAQQPSTQSGASTKEVSAETALDKAYASPKLGIRFRYPSTLYMEECGDIMMRTQENPYGVDFIAAIPPSAPCAERNNEVMNTIHAHRAATEAQLQAFVDQVFSPRCRITSIEDFEDNGTQFAHVLLEQSGNPKPDEPDFLCGEMPRWNKDAGVITFSKLGSKTGGGIDWPSENPVNVSGSTDYSYDYAIMQSIEYLPQTGQ